MCNDNILTKGIDGTLKGKVPKNTRDIMAAMERPEVYKAFNFPQFKFKIIWFKSENRISLKHVDQTYDGGK